MKRSIKFIMALLLVFVVSITTVYAVDLHFAHVGAESINFKQDKDDGGLDDFVVWHFVLNKQKGATESVVLNVVFEKSGAKTTIGKLNPGGAVYHFFVGTNTHDKIISAEVPGVSKGKLLLSHVRVKGKPIETPVEPIETPVETPTEPIETPTEPIETPTETPVEPIETPVEPIETPVELIETPTERIETPVEPTTEPIETPVEGSLPTTGEASGLWPWVGVLSFCTGFIIIANKKK